MWATLDLLVRREARGRDLSENVEEWLEGVNRKIAASADGVEGGGKKGRKGKGKAAIRGDGARKERPKRPAAATAAHEEATPNPKAEEATKVYEEEKRGRNGVRTWNPRTGRRGHDREIGKRVENLMGTSVVKFTDRKYMMELQQRILESHYESTEKRMNNRMNEEIEREKRLILENKMPLNEVSGLSSHPVFVVRNGIANNPRVLALNASSKKRFAKAHDTESAIRKQEEQEKRMDAGSRVKKKKKKATEQKETSQGGSLLSEGAAEKASMKVLLDLSEFEGGKESSEGELTGMGRARRLQRTLAEDRGGQSEGGDLNIKHGSPSLLDECDDEIDWEEDVENEELIQVHDGLSDDVGFSPSLESRNTMEETCDDFLYKEPEKVKYELPLVKELRRAETVDQLYELAEQIVGPVPPCINTK